MASGALKNQPKQKSGGAIALPAPPPPRSLNQIELKLCVEHLLEQLNSENVAMDMVILLILFGSDHRAGSAGRMAKITMYLNPKES